MIITAAFYLYSTTRCRSIVLCKSPIVLEEFALSVLMGKHLYLPWERKQQVSSKRCKMSAEVHGVTYWKWVFRHVWRLSSLRENWSLDIPTLLFIIFFYCRRVSTASKLLDALGGGHDPFPPVPRYYSSRWYYHQSQLDGTMVHHKLKADMGRIKVVNKIRWIIHNIIRRYRKLCAEIP